MNKRKAGAFVQEAGNATQADQQQAKWTATRTAPLVQRDANIPRDGSPQPKRAKQAPPRFQRSAETMDAADLKILEGLMRAVLAAARQAGPVTGPAWGPLKEKGWGATGKGVGSRCRNVTTCAACEYYGPADGGGERKKYKGLDAALGPALDSLGLEKVQPSAETMDEADLGLLEDLMRAVLVAARQAGQVTGGGPLKAAGWGETGKGVGSRGRNVTTCAACEYYGPADGDGERKTYKGLEAALGPALDSLELKHFQRGAGSSGEAAQGAAGAVGEWKAAPLLAWVKQKCMEFAKKEGAMVPTGARLSELGWSTREYEEGEARKWGIPFDLLNKIVAPPHRALTGKEEAFSDWKDLGYLVIAALRSLGWRPQIQLEAVSDSARRSWGSPHPSPAVSKASSGVEFWPKATRTLAEADYEVIMPLAHAVPHRAMHSRKWYVETIDAAKLGELWKILLTAGLQRHAEGLKRHAGGEEEATEAAWQSALARGLIEAARRGGDSQWTMREQDVQLTAYRRKSEKAYSPDITLFGPKDHEDVRPEFKVEVKSTSDLLDPKRPIHDGPLAGRINLFGKQGYSTQSHFGCTVTGMNGRSQLLLWRDVRQKGTTTAGEGNGQKGVCQSLPAAPLPLQALQDGLEEDARHLAAKADPDSSGVCTKWRKIARNSLRLVTTMQEAQTDLRFREGLETLKEDEKIGGWAVMPHLEYFYFFKEFHDGLMQYFPSTTRQGQQKFKELLAASADWAEKKGMSRRDI